MALTTKLAGLAAGALLTASAAFAQTYPERQITMVVPFSAGGPTDTVGRLIAERMSADLGQQIIVENVGGAGGTLGAGNVAGAEADGYTILLHHIGMATSATLYRNLAYNPLEAFEYVGLVTEVPMTIVARKDFEPTDFASFIAYVKENADTITMANAGIGAASHLCGMLFMQAIEAPIVTVPYKGTGPAMTELLGGQIDIMCDQTTNTAEQIKGGTIKALCGNFAGAAGHLPRLANRGRKRLRRDGGFGLARALRAEGHPGRGGGPAVRRAAIRAGRPGDCREAGGTGHRAVARGGRHARRAEGQAEAEIARWKPVIETAGVYAD